MSTTYSPLSDADDSENQLVRLIQDFQDLTKTVLKMEEGDIKEQNAINMKLEGDIGKQNHTILKLEGDIEEQNAINLKLEDDMKELKTMDCQVLPTSLESPETTLDSLSENSKPENDNEPRQSSDGTISHSYYRRPCSLVYISYGFRFLFTCLVWDRSGSTWLIASSLLFLSVVTLFSRRHEEENESLILYCIRIAGWLINLTGASVFHIQRISAILLAFGHSLELVHLLLSTKKLEYKAYILSLSCCIAGFILRVISESSMPLHIAGSTLLVIHALAQYFGILYETPPPEVPAHDDTVQQDLEPLPEDMLDSFTFMMVSDDVKVWNFGFLIFLIQSSLAIMILIDQVVLGETSILFDAPITVPPFVTIAQFIGLFVLCTFWQSDILTSIKVLDIFWFKKENDKEWPYKEIHAKDGKFWTWLDKIFLPNALRFFGGLLVLLTSVVVIVKSEDIIDLFKDFTALILISQIDNIAFSLAHQYYFGDKLKDESDRIKGIRVNETSHYRICGVPIRLFAVLVISAGVFSGWAYFVIGQQSGTFFLLEIKRKYPKCDVANPTFLGDKTCHGGDYNKKQCGYDDGDCTNFNTRYPDCNVEDPTLIGDGECTKLYNTTVCRFDGGDCIDLGGLCRANPFYIGDGECDHEYNTAECRFDGGDCCDVDRADLIGDGECNLGPYNTPECGFDGGDCIEFNKYPDCNVGLGLGLGPDYFPSYIGDGKCDGVPYNKAECGFDGGDCIEFNSKYPDCNEEKPFFIGDGDCDGDDYNTAECGFDGGDCIEFNSKYPNCKAVFPSFIGDGVCNDGYNTPECGFDGGDCL